MPIPAWAVFVLQLVLQRLHRGGDAAAAVDHDRRAELADGHDGRVAQQAAKVQHIAGLVADGGDDAHRRRLAVHHADGGFIRNQGTDDLGGGIARDDHHVAVSYTHLTLPTNSRV